ncbi:MULTISPECIES: flagellar motor switch protein FliG [Amphritea]|uniref:Flagellar motor switch protein FliG n=2 Tax=Amphritea TaxID=515417 RepID=A0A1H9L8I2_9GAMM|nr:MULTISPECIES: flagellar motor switch protein FliG [Amphritea]MBN0986824.1 flagellar motor switch protein FliG [Amphritea pacifica]MBN1005265.1 flagellar motor switch protein FliG [Amphritea pacifica]SER07670.1 flagellar motor switch protein FliG [Amphritea atlantica]
MNDQVTESGVELTNVQKAAVLLISLGEADAAEVLRYLGQKEVQQLGLTMSNLDNIPQSTVEAVMADFMEAISDQTSIGINNDHYIKEMLSQALGSDRAQTLVDRILMTTNTSGLESLKWMDSRQVAEIIRYEHPQIQAVVIAYLDPDQAAHVLQRFDENVRLEIMMRITSLDQIQPSALQELNDILESQFSGASSQSASLGGLKTTANIMNYFDSNIEQELMEKIREVDEALGDQISEMMFVFDNLIDVEDRGIQVILREINTDTLVVALKGAETGLQDKIFKNMSKRAAELLRDDLEAKGPVRVSEVEDAQKEILNVARRLADEGEIVLGSGGEEMM